MGMVSKKKILHIITGLSTGGAERALYNLLQGGLSTKFDNRVISLSDTGTMGPQIEALSVPVIALGMRRGVPSLSALLKLRKVVHEFSPDLIQGWMYHGNLAATLARAICPGNVALVWNIRQSLYCLADEKPLTRQVIRLNRFLSQGPDALLYNSYLSRQQHEAFGFCTDQGQVIPNGISLQKFKFSAQSRQKVRSELGIPEDALVLGHVARLHPMKDHPLFLRSVVELVQRYSNLHVLLSGRGVTIENQSLAALIPDDLREQFHLLDERRDVHELMSAMDVASSSSYGEAFPNVVGEAMAASLPCVVTDVGDSALIVGDIGVVVPPRDKETLVAGLGKMLQMSAEDRRSLGEQARQRIEENFTLSVIVEKYASLYVSVIQEKSSK